ncbi:TRAP transporter small permease [Paramicrobacterium chengjingii]|uniref:TRAP transporter small permease n=1 Tax=Paramicrobacterium chengjingii TaxID=2769067 RepID=A0ABX6YHQ7_9MICO|nr:TRAP transporter small permease [Microbacterium chengjingii]QPZ38323.1 TRAP transporter small permease [Microbacterium chengjingii]
MRSDNSRTLPGHRAGRLVADVLERIEELASGVLIVGIFGLVFGQVIFRYVLDSPPFWIEEIARTGMVWLTFIAAAMVTSKVLHLVMTMITDRLGQRASIVFTYFGELTILVTSVALVPAAWHLVSTLGGVSSSTGLLPRSALFLAPLIGFGLMALHSFINILWKKPHEAPGEVAL